MVHQPELVGEPDVKAQAMIVEGIEEGRSARELLQNCVLVETGDGKLHGTLKEASHLTADDKAPVIVEATFNH